MLQAAKLVQPALDELAASKRHALMR
jgi:hypothetical protein